MRGMTSLLVGDKECGKVRTRCEGLLLLALLWLD